MSHHESAAYLFLKGCEDYSTVMSARTLKTNPYFLRRLPFLIQRFPFRDLPFPFSNPPHPFQVSLFLVSGLSRPHYEFYESLIEASESCLLFRKYRFGTLRTGKGIAKTHIGSRETEIGTRESL